MTIDEEVVDADIAVIGGGPAGLYATYRAGRLGMTTAVIEASGVLGGMLHTSGADLLISDVPGRPTTRGRELLADLVEQSTSLGSRMLLDQRATAIDVLPGEWRFGVRTSHGRTVRCSNVVIATGVHDAPPPGIPCGKAFFRRGVDYGMGDPDDYEGDAVMIAGAGGAAVRWARAMTAVADNVTLIEPDPGFLANAQTIDELHDMGVELACPAHITTLGGNGRLEWAELRQEHPDGLFRQRVDRVIVSVGFASGPGLVESVGLHGPSNGWADVTPEMRTTVPGIYAVGDVATYAGKIRRVATGFAEAATAIDEVAKEYHKHRAPGVAADRGNAGA